MTVAYALLAITAVVALVDWLAVSHDQHALEYVTKVGVMVGLIAVALVIPAVSGTQRAFFLVALALGLLSDVFLMLPRDLFLAGLVAALLEHLAYIGGFRARDLHVAWLAAATLVALASAGVFLPPIVRAVSKARPALVNPVLAYVTVFVVMVASAGGTGSPVALAGALLFFYSDAILAWNRFVKPVPNGRVVNLVPYHLGQALLVLSLAF